MSCGQPRDTIFRRDSAKPCDEPVRSPLRGLFFEEVRVPADNLLGGVEGQGFSQLMADLPYERMMIGVGALAAMEGAYRATVDYVRERQAFGRPIADFQNTRFKLAEVATQITVGRAFIDRCVEQLLAGVLVTATASIHREKISLSWRSLFIPHSETREEVCRCRAANSSNDRRPRLPREPRANRAAGAVRHRTRRSTISIPPVTQFTRTS